MSKLLNFVVIWNCNGEWIQVNTSTYYIWYCVNKASKKYRICDGKIVLKKYKIIGCRSNYGYFICSFIWVAKSKSKSNPSFLLLFSDCIHTKQILIVKYKPFYVYMWGSENTPDPMTLANQGLFWHATFSRRGDTMDFLEWVFFAHVWSTCKRVGKGNGSVF